MRGENVNAVENIVRGVENSADDIAELLVEIEASPRGYRRKYRARSRGSRGLRAPFGISSHGSDSAHDLRAVLFVALALFRNRS